MYYNHCNIINSWKLICVYINNKAKVRKHFRILSINIKKMKLIIEIVEISKSKETFHIRTLLSLK